MFISSLYVQSNLLIQNNWGSLDNQSGLNQIHKFGLDLVNYMGTQECKITKNPQNWHFQIFSPADLKLCLCVYGILRNIVLHISHFW